MKIQMSEKLTPMLKQYIEIKSRYKDAFLFFRMGDFYEMFFEDAVEGAKILNITLTSRNTTPDGEKIPMCGVPYHSVKQYIKKMLEHGKRIAICEQVEDPKKAKGVVKREVTQIITPGVQFDDDTLVSFKNNFLLSIYPYKENRFALSYIDISTGKLRSTVVFGIQELLNEIARIEPSEILVPKDEPFVKNISVQNSIITPVPKESFRWDNTQIKTTGYCFAEQYRSIGALFSYLKETNPNSLLSVDEIEVYQIREFMRLDRVTKSNLEIFETLYEKKRKGSLIGTIDITKTVMGSRMLRQWLSYPLMSVVEINRRLNGVEEFYENRMEREEIREHLAKIGDIERITTRVISGYAGPRDIWALKNSLVNLARVKDILKSFESEIVRNLVDKIDDFAEITDLIEGAIKDDPPAQTKDGGFIKRGFSKELDDLFNIRENAKNYLLNFEKRERERTGIKNLKVKYNKVFGYFIEVTKSNLKLVPKNYIRKQTLATGERYYTPELKEYETKILNSDELILELEKKIFEKIVESIARIGVKILDAGESCAKIDVLSSLAELAYRKNYVRPKVYDSKIIKIEDGRHPVIEESLPPGKFIPNDFEIDGEEKRVCIITGPNMSGKSTIMRQIAIIVLLAQTGSFVPAKEAHIGITDGIFTRVGASDNIYLGHSTFMVEMVETAEILKKATDKSLIILDEIGRGTSTFDGLSIAWAVCEYIHDKIKARTIFATHYHELTEIEKTKPGVLNFTISIKEWNDQIIFLRKLIKGKSNRSYGIEVAKLAGIDDEIIKRAKEILKNLELKEFDENFMPAFSRSQSSQENMPLQLSLFRNVAEEKKQRQSAKKDDAVEYVLNQIKKININKTTPLEALNLLFKLQKKLKS